MTDAAAMTMEETLAHFGVKGMKWGVRKEERLTSNENYSKDFKQKENVYRIVAAEGSRKLKDISYVSTNDVDNNRYIHILNHTISARLFKSGRYEKQLVLGPKVPLKAPSIKKAESEMEKLYKTNPKVQKFVKDNEIYFGPNPDAKKVNQLINTALVDDDRLFVGSTAVRQEVKKHFQDQGYNSLLDQNDIREGLAKSPLIVFDPEKTLRVVSESKIDEAIKKASTVKYKETKKEWLDRFHKEMRVGMTAVNEMTIDQALMHFGVLGMKWGKHRAKADSLDIRAARRNVARQATGVERSAQAKANTNNPNHPELKAKHAEVKTAFLKNPDRVIAARMTRGEKAVAVILFGPAGLGAIAGTSAVSRRIERKQEKGKYDKKS